MKKEDSKQRAREDDSNIDGGSSSGNKEYTDLGLVSSFAHEVLPHIPFLSSPT